MSNAKQKLEKSELACRLLDRAIAMYFDGEDPLFVMTLAHPAHLILQKLAERKFPGKNMSQLVWSELDAKGIKGLEDGSSIQNYNGFLNFLHRVPNAAKHADRESETHVEYEENNPVAILVIALSHAQQLNCLTPTGLRFIMWTVLCSETAYIPEFIQLAEAEFPGLKQMPKEERLKLGQIAIKRDYWPK